jgi:hypothetical protein
MAAGLGVAERRHRAIVLAALGRQCGALSDVLSCSGQSVAVARERAPC